MLAVELFPRPDILIIFGEFTSGFVTVILESIAVFVVTKTLFLSISSPTPPLTVVSPDPSAVCDIATVL